MTSLDQILQCQAIKGDSRLMKITPSSHSRAKLNLSLLIRLQCQHFKAIQFLNRMGFSVNISKPSNLLFHPPYSLVYVDIYIFYILYIYMYFLYCTYTHTLSVYTCIQATLAIPLLGLFCHLCYALLTYKR